MKSRIVLYVVIATVLTGAGMLLRSDPQPSGADEGKETRAETTPARVSEPSAARPAEVTPEAPVKEIAEIPSFAEQVRKFEKLSEEELGAAEASINREFDNGTLIARANAGFATDADRVKLTALIRRRNAIYAVKTERLIASAKR